MHAAIDRTATTFIPQITTKELALEKTPAGGRRVRLSSNFLPLYGFKANDRHDFVPVGGVDAGLRVVCNPTGSHKVYTRTYKQRRNNPLETQIELTNQTLINQGIPAYSERIHIEMRRGELIIRPLANRTFSIRRSFDKFEGKPAAFVAMTSGIDAKCLSDCGFEIDSILEYRPQEKRDNQDFTETGALSAISNVAPRLLVNEDITKVNHDRLKALMTGAKPMAMLHISIQCDEFSPLKTNKQKADHVASLDTSVDLVYDALRLVETVQPAMVMVENVPGFASHPNGELMKIKLQKWGYHVTEATMDGRDFGGLTGRTRYYLVASVWPGFTMPEATGRRVESIWSDVERFLPECRDVSHTKSVQLGIETGRIRVIRPDSISAPTVTKSQNRQCKDSIYIEHEGRFLLPSVELLAHLNGVHGFDLSHCGESIASEIVGQSIEVPMHEAICREALAHIHVNTGSSSVVSITRKTAQAATKAVSAPSEMPVSAAPTIGKASQFAFQF